MGQGCGAALVWRCCSSRQESDLLTSEVRSAILRVSADYWKSAVQKDEFTAIAVGKEIGHKIADMVDERTTALLSEHFSTAYQRKPNGDPTPRSMGDIWVKDSGMFNPVNVKSGEVGKNGRPNMVAIGRVFPALVAGKIDSYYLLIVKMDLRSNRRDADVYLVDLFDYLDYTHLDTGPGQITLKEALFYEAIKNGYEPPIMTLVEKAEKLYSMLVEADARLRGNREKRQSKFRKDLNRYKRQLNQPIDQSGMNLA